MIPDDELRHLRDGPRPDERPGGAGLAEVRVVHAPGSVGSVVERARAVLEIVVSEQVGHSFGSVDWSGVLPGWFVDSCAPIRTPEQTEAFRDRLRDLDDAGRIQLLRQQPWTLDAWVSSMDPDEERDWYWWAAQLLDDRIAVICVEVEGFPFGTGSLGWLLRCAGAEEISFN